ncbi:hypothetical protein [uncultured Tenacibaculum sp.]|uniref:hypothetical protein n=1 Tax=uncultured Tenacibaculum sp. TaxID=174713 RepID=UPI0026177C1B|nr:hypothetical protein [uncultured Tenacibaculum sp.]
MKNSILNLGSVMSISEQRKVLGGVPREEYCKTLEDLIFGGGFQGDRKWARKVLNQNCS